MGGLIRHSTNKGIMYTEGVSSRITHDLSLMWFLDLIAEKQRNIPMANYAFQIWTQRVSDGHIHISVTTDDKSSAIWTQHFPDPDNQQSTIEWWVDGGTIMLPEEFKA